MELLCTIVLLISGLLHVGNAVRDTSHSLRHRHDQAEAVCGHSVTFLRFRSETRTQVTYCGEAFDVGPEGLEIVADCRGSDMPIRYSVNGQKRTITEFVPDEWGAVTIDLTERPLERVVPRLH